ncbi:MAG: response regulator [Dehalococcoidia bacterium]|nr:response regulator [Dehalococcoidia bacterium]
MSRVLVVDDEASVTKYLEECLINLGYDVVGSASSGEEAVAMATKFNPDIILMDIVMPGKLDGIDASEIIRTKLGIPVIFLTAYADDTFVNRARCVEPSGYIVKPFQDKELAATIEVALYHSKQERKRHELAEQYHNVFYAMGYGVIICDAGLKIISCNPAAATMLGYSAKKIKGKAFESIIPQHCFSAYQEAIYQAALKARSHTRVESVELAALRKDGSEFPADVSISICEASTGTLYIAIINDITKRKKRKELEQKAQQASRLTTISDMASGIAHEINNPLTGVIGFSQLLAQEENEPEDVRNYARRISIAGQRVASIVDSLLTFSRQNKPQREYVNINDIVEVALKLQSHKLKAARIKVITSLAPDLPWTMADATQLQHVFLDLLSNAEAEMKKAHGKGKLQVKTEAIDGTIRISFKDDGPGIAPENIDRIFDPFFTTRQVGKGAGLALSRCHGIITEHNGRIYAKSTLGHGATFIVELPILTEEELAPNPTPARGV